MKKLIILLLALTSCTLTPARKAQWAATGNIVASEATKIAEQTVYSAAQSELDLVAKGEVTASFGDALRTLEGSVTVASINQVPDLVAQLRATWLPAKTHWDNLAEATAQLVQREVKLRNPQTPADVNAIIEGVIKGLQTPPVVANP